MSYLDTLRSRRKTPQAAWHKLRTSIETGKFQFFAAFEGEEDEEFFSAFIVRRFSDATFRPIICDGKGGVLALQEAVVAKYGSTKNVFFFVDSDHDRFLGQDKYPNGTFSSCGYSVESYFYDKTILRSAICKYFQLNKSDELCKEIDEALEHDFRVFGMRAKTIMTYAVGLRVADQSPDLDALHFSDIFEFTNSGLVTKKIECQHLIDKIGTNSLSFHAFRNLLGILKSHSTVEIVRGKLVSQFILAFYRNLPRRFKGRTKLNGKALHSKIELSKANLISVLTDFAPMPVRLEKFLDDLGRETGLIHGG